MASPAAGNSLAILVIFVNILEIFILVMGFWTRILEMSMQVAA